MTLHFSTTYVCAVVLKKNIYIWIEIPSLVISEDFASHDYVYKYIHIYQLQ